MFARNMTLKLQPNQLMRFIQTYLRRSSPFSKSKGIPRRSLPRFVDDLLKMLRFADVDERDVRCEDFVGY